MFDGCCYCCSSGAVFDATKDYNSSFHVGGVMMMTGGLLCCTLHLPRFKSAKARKEEELARIARDESAMLQITSMSQLSSDGRDESLHV